MTSLLEFEILNSAAYFEKIFYYIILLTAKLEWGGLEHEIVFMLVNKLAKLHLIIVHRLIIQEMELLKDVDKVNLIILSNVPLNNR